MASSRRVPVSIAPGAAIPASIAEELAGLVTLGDVMKWGFAQSPPRSPSEIVTQDEYTHDVVLQLEPDCYLVFDTT